jgi:hypothetical protein
MLIFEIYPSILIKKGKKSVERQNLTELYLYYNKSGIKLLSLLRCNPYDIELSYVRPRKVTQLRVGTGQ